MTSIEWAAWVQAVGSVIAVFVAIGLGRRSESRSRELLEGERRRQAAIAIDMMVRRLHSVAREAKAKILWLQQDGSPEAFGRPEPWQVIRSEGERLKLSSGRSLAENAHTTFFLTGMAATQAVATIEFIGSYNALVDAELATHNVKDPVLGSFYRQRLEAKLISQLRMVALNAEESSETLEREWRLPGSPVPGHHRPPSRWRRAISFSWFRSWMSAKDRPNS